MELSEQELAVVTLMRHGANMDIWIDEAVTNKNARGMLNDFAKMMGKKPEHHKRPGYSFWSVNGRTDRNIRVTAFIDERR